MKSINAGAVQFETDINENKTSSGKNETISGNNEIGITKTSHEASVSESLSPHHNGSKKFGLHRDEIIPQFRIPFIVTGYRRPNMNAIECLHSAFVPCCNETINVWSHFIALLLFMMKFYILFKTSHPLDDTSNWPLLSASLGICGFCLASSSAHMFNSMSPSAQHSCFFMDYAAIGVYSVGVGQAFYFYGRPIQNEVTIFKTEWLFTTVSLLTSIITTFLCCITRHNWLKYRYVIRTSSFVAPFLVNASPYLYRMIHCANEVDCISENSLRVFNIHCFFYISSAVINMLRIPERVFPGKFDLLGHSHHFLHIFTAIGASYQFDSVHLDMVARKEHLIGHPVQGNVYNTLLPFLISVVTNFGIAYVFGKRIRRADQSKNK